MVRAVMIYNVELCGVLHKKIELLYLC